jgi:hypothetical protein
MLCNASQSSSSALHGPFLNMTIKRYQCLESHHFSNLVMQAMIAKRPESQKPYTQPADTGTPHDQHSLYFHDHRL